MCIFCGTRWIICRARSLWNWSDLSGSNYIGLGTQYKYYIYNGGTYNDITPLYQAETLTNPFTTTNGSATLTVTDGNYAPNLGDFVIFSGGTAVGGLTISGEYQVTKLVSSVQYQIIAASNATSTATGGGTVTANYEYPTGLDIYTVGNGYGTGPYGGAAIQLTATLGSNPFASTSGSSTLTVTHTLHGLSNGNFVIFSGATTFAGIPAVVLNTVYAITYVNANSYTISIATIAPGMTASASTSGGGAAVSVLMQTGTRGWRGRNDLGVG